MFLCLVDAFQLFKTFLIPTFYLYVPGFFSDFSLRPTCAMKLFQSVVDEQLIQRTTEHCSFAVRSYKRHGVEQEKEVSSIIQGAKRPCVATLSAPVSSGSMVQPFDVGVQPLATYSPICSSSMVEPLI